MKNLPKLKPLIKIPFKTSLNTDNKCNYPLVTNGALRLLSAVFDLEMQIERWVAEVSLPAAAGVVAFAVRLVACATTRFLIFHYLIIRGNLIVRAIRAI